MSILAQSESRYSAQRKLKEIAIQGLLTRWVAAGLAGDPARPRGGVASALRRTTAALSAATAATAADSFAPPLEGGGGDLRRLLPDLAPAGSRELPGAGRGL